MMRTGTAVVVPGFISRKIPEPVGWWLGDCIGAVFALEARFSLCRILCDSASGTLMNSLEGLKFPPVPSILPVYADMEVLGKRLRNSWWRKECYIHVDFHLYHSDFHFLGKTI